ncbi:hypothetical protein [Xanthobacter agilis]|uniref:Transmembrane protein n=1 Tax=Xanthobacter agilis TaxID=47492 RepID=A0ABU0LEF6_XANAG|nr:hypothetical protein [Xanthobacter agilis]MDQ0505525.1 hypothetical protein [Xanthobacter agilis]
MLTPVPLLIIPLALFNIVAFLTPSLDWSAPLALVSMLSGAQWKITLAEAFIATCLLVLFFEILKSTRISSRSLIDHLLSILLFGVSLAEFLLVPQAGNSVFALMLAVMLLDVMTGFSVSIRVAQRDLSVRPDAG